MKVRVSYLAVACSAVVMLVSAFRHNTTHPAQHADSLTRFQAITSYCEEADPVSSAQYIAKLGSPTKGLPGNQTAGPRTSDKYRDAMVQAVAALSSASMATVVKTCTKFLAGK